MKTKELKMKKRLFKKLVKKFVAGLKEISRIAKGIK